MNGNSDFHSFLFDHMLSIGNRLSGLKSKVSA
jgi:hypothetical protein